MARPRTVVDASVIVSALFGGVPATALEAALTSHLVVSPPIVQELFAVVGASRAKLGEEGCRTLRRYVKRVIARAELVEITGILAICRDPKDDAYLETCRIGGARYLVTGDRDLLETDIALLRKNKLGNLAILSPAEFVKRYATHP